MVERELVREHAVDVDDALSVHIHILLDVAAERDGSHDAACEPFALHEFHGVEIVEHFFFRSAVAYDDGLAPRSGDVERLALDAFAGDGDDDVLRAVFCDGFNCFDRVFVLGVDSVRGAAFFRELQLVFHDIDGDDRAGAGDSCALDGGQADSSAADDGDAFPGLDLAAV